MKILFLAANPSGSTQLNLDKEINSIDDALQRSKLKEKFQLVSKWAVDSSTLRRSLLAEEPDIVHFSGHGEGQAGLVLEGQDGRAKPATSEALFGLFKQFPSIKCVVLNACFAEVQAQAIVQHIDYVVGMKQAVRDDAAIAFATGFYDALGYGQPLEDAFEFGRNAIQFELSSFSQTTRKLIPVALEETEPLPDHLIPVLLKKEMSSAERLSRSTRLIPEADSLSETTRIQDNATKANYYRERVQEFLSDHQLTKLERSQLATLANVLGLSEQEANRILQEEQNKPSEPSQRGTSHRSWLTRINNTKKALIGCAAFLMVAAGGSLIYQQATPKYPQLQSLLADGSWKDADEETARILWRIADRKEERVLRAEDFKRIPCSDLRDINDLWEKYTQKHFGFGVQKRIWNSDAINSDLSKFILRVGWGAQNNKDGSVFYLLMDGQSFDLSAPVGRLPWAVTYYGGNNETRVSYMSRLVQCLP